LNVLHKIDLTILISFSNDLFEKVNFKRRVFMILRWLELTLAQRTI